MLQQFAVAGSGQGWVPHRRNQQPAEHTFHVPAAAHHPTTCMQLQGTTASQLQCTAACNAPLAACRQLHAICARGLGLRRGGQLWCRLGSCSSSCCRGSPVVHATGAAWSTAAVPAAAETAAARRAAASHCCNKAAAVAGRQSCRRRRRVRRQAGRRRLSCGYLITCRSWQCRQMRSHGAGALQRETSEGATRRGHQSQPTAHLLRP